MNNYNKRRYQEYADNIPYAPNIKNLFTGGGGMSTLEEVMGESSSEVPSKNSVVTTTPPPKNPTKPTSNNNNLFDTISVVGQALGEGLGEIGTYREKQWQDYQQNELNQFKRTEALNQEYNKFQNALQQNQVDAGNQWDVARQQMIEDRAQRQQQALDAINNNNAANVANNNLQASTPYNPNKFMIGGLIQAGIAVDKGLGQAIGGEYHSGAGDIMSKIPGLGIVGGLTNALFGEKEDKAKLTAIDTTESNLTNAAMNNSVATSFNQLKGRQAVDYSNANAYTGGIFNTSADSKNAALRDRLDRAVNYADRSIENSADNITQNQRDSLAAGYYAYGGLLSPAELFAAGGILPKKKRGYQEGNIYNIDENEYNRLLEEGYQVEIINQ